MTLRMIGDRRYNSLHIRYHFLLDRLSRKDILLVYQMGKVGSTSVVRSLGASPEVIKKMVIYQTHFLTEKGINFVQQLEEHGYGGWSNLPSKTKRVLLTERYLGRRLKAGRLCGRQCKVISLVRDPIATNLSGFFYNYHWWPEGLRRMCEIRKPGWQKALLECFLASYPHSVSLTWFDTEMRMIFGLDVYETPFAKERGYSVYENERVHLLVLKLERLRESASQAIRDFLGISEFRLTTANRGSKKWYGEIYQTFLQDVKLSNEYRQKMLTSQHVNHFYSFEERNQFDSLYAGAL